MEINYNEFVNNFDLYMNNLDKECAVLCGMTKKIVLFERESIDENKDEEYNNSTETCTEFCICHIDYEKYINSDAVITNNYKENRQENNRIIRDDIYNEKKLDNKQEDDRIIRNDICDEKKKDNKQEDDRIIKNDIYYEKKNDNRQVDNKKITNKSLDKEDKEIERLQLKYKNIIDKCSQPDDKVGKIIMKAINYTNVRDNFRGYCDEVIDNSEAIIVTRKNNRNVVMVSEDTYNNMLENMYLRSSKQNYDRLLESKNQIEAGICKERKLIRP